MKKILKKNSFYIYFAFVISFVILSCNKNTNFNKIVGKVYFYKDSVYELTAGFDKDTLYYIMKDQGPPRFHKSKYKLKKVNDTTFQLQLSNKPKFWEKDTWEIVVKGDKEIYSSETNKIYKIYSDTLFKF